jgi:uncharacterized protein
MPADFEQARRYAVARLEHDLLPNLHYHSAAHTLDDVLPAVERLAELEAVPEAGRFLLRTAALYHDLGFTERRAGHEAVSLQIAAEILPGCGYSREQVAAILSMILATRLPQSPQTPWEAILADADLDVLGREDFWPRNAELRAEWAAYGQVTTDAEWYVIQIKFLSEHRYFTAAARALREAGKQAYLAELQERLVRSTA